MVKAAWLLASAFTTAIHINNNQPVNNAYKEEKYQDSLEKVMLRTEIAKNLVQSENREDNIQCNIKDGT